MMLMIMTILMMLRLTQQHTPLGSAYIIFHTLSGIYFDVFTGIYFICTYLELFKTLLNLPFLAQYQALQYKTDVKFTYSHIHIKFHLDTFKYSQNCMKIELSMIWIFLLEWHIYVCADVLMFTSRFNICIR